MKNYRIRLVLGDESFNDLRKREKFDYQFSVRNSSRIPWAKVVTLHYDRLARIEYIPTGAPKEECTYKIGLDREMIERINAGKFVCREVCDNIRFVIRKKKQVK